MRDRAPTTTTITSNHTKSNHDNRQAYSPFCVVSSASRILHDSGRLYSMDGCSFQRQIVRSIAGTGRKIHACHAGLAWISGAFRIEIAAAAQYVAKPRQPCRSGSVASPQKRRRLDLHFHVPCARSPRRHCVVPSFLLHVMCQLQPAAISLDFNGIGAEPWLGRPMCSAMCRIIATVVSPRRYSGARSTLRRMRASRRPDGHAAVWVIGWSGGRRNCAQSRIRDGKYPRHSRSIARFIGDGTRNGPWSGRDSTLIKSSGAYWPDIHADARHGKNIRAALLRRHPGLLPA